MLTPTSKMTSHFSAHLLICFVLHETSTLLFLITYCSSKLGTLALELLYYDVWMMMVFAAERQLTDTVFYNAELLREHLLM